MTGPLVLLVVLALIVGVVLGGWIIDGYWREERAQLGAREARVRAQWHALQAAHRLNAAFWVARQAMRREAERYPGDE